MEKILITGGAGFIGKRLVAEAVSRGLHVIVVDNNENDEMMLLKTYGKTKITVANISITNKLALTKLFAKHKPDYVIHAAAHKHVSLVEANPQEGIENNILGSLNIFDLCMQYSVKKCLYISTDKADAPESVYGLTKKVSEELAMSYAKLSKTTSFLITRFCNVLYSSGSVTEIFEKQIKENIPLTVTDFRMERYFITVEQAVSFVSKVLFDVGVSGHIYMLNVEKPTKIYDLAKQLLEKAHKDLPIIETGILPGERLTEPYNSNSQLHVVDDIYLVR